MQLNTEFACNSVVWISSLAPNDEGPTRRMVAEMTGHAQALGFAFEHIAVSGRAELSHLLAGLASRTEHRHMRPLVHLDTHGNKDDGLFIEGENVFVAWDDLAQMLREINVPSRNNLAVVGATCFGLHAIRPINLSTPTPFFLLLSPEEKVSNGFLETNIPRFYRTLFEVGSVEAAFANISERFNYFHCEKLLFIAIARYLAQQCAGKSRLQRRERLLTEIMSQGMENTLDNRRLARQMIKQGTRPDQSLIDRFAGRFLIGRPCSFQFEELQAFVEAAKLDDKR